MIRNFSVRYFILQGERNLSLSDRVWSGCVPEVGIRRKEAREREKEEIVKISRRRVSEIGEGDLDSREEERWWGGGAEPRASVNSARFDPRGRTKRWHAALGEPAHRRGGALVFTASPSPLLPAEDRALPHPFLVRFNFYEHPPSDESRNCLFSGNPPRSLPPTDFFSFFSFLSRSLFFLHHHFFLLLSSISISTEEGKRRIVGEDFWKRKWKIVEGIFFFSPFQEFCVSSIVSFDSIEIIRIFYSFYWKS